ncbi:MAG: presenilin family intramembrane aspartyl protease [Candidatus Woesearchaeota archaeon]
MKHTLKVTIFLLSFFVLAQVTGLWLINKDATIKINDDGSISVSHSDTSLGERPRTEGFGSFLYLIIGVAVGTIIVLILVKFKKSNIWRYWFFLAVWMALSIAIGVLVKTKIFFDYDVAMIIALILAIWKIWRPNIFIHNLTEVLIYSGIAVLLVPIFDVFWAIMLLLAISLYDMYAVWKSKHMVKMAKFQTKSNVFAGLMIPYKSKDNQLEKSTINKKDKLATSKSINSVSLKVKGLNVKKPKTAILGGGDVVFPLIMTGAVMENLLREGLTKSQAFLQSSIMILTTTIALALLFFFAKKDKFYPAMPFITAGCLLGWVIVIII